MRRTLIFGGLLVALIGVPVAVAGSSGVASNSKTFADSTGEDEAAPDITSIRVSNDDAGVMTFRIAISNRPVLAQDMVVLIYIDSVRGAGDPETLGADYAIQLDAAGIALFRWDGSTYTSVLSSASFTYAATGPTIRLSAADLSGAKSMNFVVLAISGIMIDANGEPSLANAHADAAPDMGHGTYNYAVLTTFSLKAAGFSLSPIRVRAGKSFSVGLAARQSDTGGLVQTGNVACAARVGRTQLRLETTRVRNGVGVCVWSIPTDARGKTIRGTIAIRLRGAQLTRSFSARVS